MDLNAPKPPALSRVPRERGVRVTAPESAAGGHDWLTIVERMSDASATFEIDPAPRPDVASGFDAGEVLSRMLLSQYGDMEERPRLPAKVARAVESDEDTDDFDPIPSCAMIDPDFEDATPTLGVDHVPHFDDDTPL